MSVVDDYLATISAPEKEVLQHIRKVLFLAVPEAEEVITYGMPGFKYQGKYLIAYAAFKDHLSIFPGAEAIEVMRSKLDGYELSKGTIQFTLEHPLPDNLIRDVVAVRVVAISRL